MMRDSNLRGSTRRDFIKGVVAASAALGLGPTRALEMLDRIGGSALAADACATSCRVVNIIAGTGSLAWFTLLWPVPSMIKSFQGGFAYDDPQKAVPLAGVQDGRPLYARKFDPNRPPLWENFGARKRVSAILTGRNNGHEAAPVMPGNSNVLAGGVGGPVQLFAGQAALQTPLQPLVPVISLKFNGQNMPYGPAAGAPPPATVPGASEMVNLFSSEASQRAERLANPRNQQLFQQYYRAFLGLSRTASSATFQRAYGDSKTAVKLVAQNLGSQLMADPAKVQQWMGPETDGKLQSMAEALLVTANAFKLGLTAQVNIPVFNDDPHGAFGDGGASAGRFADGLASVLQGFMDELANGSEVGCNKRLSDNVVITVSGDLPKDPYTRQGWPDNTPGASNWVYVMSNGWIKPGWFGDVQPNSKVLFDPLTGQNSPNQTEDVATNASLAAVLFAVCQGDDRQVRNFFAGEYEGLVNKSLVG